MMGGLLFLSGAIFRVSERRSERRARLLNYKKLFIYHTKPFSQNDLFIPTGANTNSHLQIFSNPTKSAIVIPNSAVAH
jgi:hypothetical protein